MQLFLFFNDLAGRWPLLDEAARVFYVSALPALGTLLLAQLLLFPRPQTASRSKTALVALLALGLGMLLVWGFDALAAQWHLGNLSPRPWMTRRVNWLVVEPQDNSFPCAEVVLAAVVACASWRLNRRIGGASWVLVAVFAVTRLFCGNNYVADVAVGAALGAGSFALCGALCERNSFARRAQVVSLGASPLVVTLLGCYGFGLSSPRFQGKLGIGRPAAAAPPPVMVTTGAASRATQGEGEGLGLAPGEESAETVALAKRSTLFLPALEAFLRGKLSPLARPFALLDVEAAPVKAGTSSYRCVAIRFQVPVGQSGARPLVAERAARLVRAAFALDSQLENVDIIAVARDEGRGLDSSQMIFAGDEVPVFTASIERKNLILPSPAWLNAPGVDGGSWLRARSLLYINERALPVSPSFPASPAVSMRAGASVRRGPQPNARTSRSVATPRKAPVAASTRFAQTRARDSTNAAPAPANALAPSTRPADIAALARPTNTFALPASGNTNAMPAKTPIQTPPGSTSQPAAPSFVRP